MFIAGQCKKCEGRVVFDVGDLDKEQTEELFKKRDFGHCAVGWHVEVGKMADYYVMDWDRSFDTSEQAIAYNNGLNKIAV